ncbi:unnamed protein product [Schistosoma curassoni]|uniref:Uncharacterized protein n=1 Tax=Schistosoma curassoni TaxID=6186 RepID=A0A183KW65_9TREM|nr:unnamed protein product [Schistosoma curassoni]
MLGNHVRALSGRGCLVWVNLGSVRNANTYLPYSEYHPNIYPQVMGELCDLEFPPDRRRLSVVNRQPQLLNTKPSKYTRQKIDCRGPETLLNKLNYHQYGIQVCYPKRLLRIVTIVAVILFSFSLLWFSIINIDLQSITR